MTRPSERPASRKLAIVLPLVVLVLVAVNVARAHPTARTAVASAYSTTDNPGVEGCTGRPLRDDVLGFASLAVPCGARVRFCLGGRCVTATRRDSGPYVAGRTFDFQAGLVRALGFSSVRAFGVRSVRWERVW